MSNGVNSNVLTVAYEENGYEFVETSLALKDAVSGLPCFAAIKWPDYDTEIVEDTINGKPVVIQLWKGWCQQFLSSSQFPGGIGGEVGIYERITGKGFPGEKPDLMPQPVWLFLREKSKLANGDFWWPVPEKNEIEFDFINPVNNTVAFHAGPQKTYWLTKWMATDSFEKYRKTQGKKWSWLPAFSWNTKTPTFAAQFVMEYKINGKTYPRW